MVTIISLIQPLFIISKSESISVKQEPKLKQYIEENAEKTDSRVDRANGNKIRTARQILALRGFLRWRLQSVKKLHDFWITASQGITPIILKLFWQIDEMSHLISLGF